MMKQFFRKCRLNTKGLTLLEAVISILLIAMVSVGVTSLFFSLSRLAKMSDTQLKLNTVMRVIKENVSKSVKKDDDIYGAGVNARTAGTQPDSTYKNLTIRDLNDNEYSYVYDLTFEDADDNIYKYWITIRKESDGDSLTRFYMEVYVDEGGT